MSKRTTSSSIFTAVMFLPTSPQPPTAAISMLILPCYECSFLNMYVKYVFIC